LTIRRAYLEDPGFRLVACEIKLDGIVVFNSADPERLRTTVEVVHEASIVPGPHEVSTQQTLTGRGVGTFSYLNGYSFRLRANHSINVEPVGGTCASVTLWFQQRYSTPLDQRPSIRFDAEPSTASASPARSPGGRTTDESPGQAR
jgi:hypothetical protein